MTIVVPIPWVLLSSLLALTIFKSAVLTVLLRNSSTASSEVTMPSCVTISPKFSGVNAFCTVSMAMAEATSPALVPPIPSATTNMLPYRPKEMGSIDWGIIHSDWHKSRLTTKLSSLFFLTKPTLVPAANLMLISDMFNFNVLNF